MTAEFTAETTALILERDQGRCARCGRYVTHGTRGVDWSIHHIQGRGKAPHLALPSNGALLCGSGLTGCHGWVGANPADAYDTGWLIRRLGVQRPGDVPVQHAVHGFVRLLDDGTTEKA